MQSSSKLLLIKPKRFYPNPETKDNHFQKGYFITHNIHKINKISSNALREFLKFEKTLLKHNIHVKVFKSKQKESPDSLFPNNWYSTEKGGKLILYPLKSPNRRKERDPLIIIDLSKEYPFITDLTDYEKAGKYLEGTGSLVLDRINKIAYCSYSERTSMELVKIWAKIIEYKTIGFVSIDKNEEIIYHTNVMMSIGTDWAVICAASIKDLKKRDFVTKSLIKSGHKLIKINKKQMHYFCGNILEVRSRRGDKMIVMSTQAFKNFTSKQKKELNKFGKIIHSSLETIEKYGGGSARCMIGERF